MPSLSDRERLLHMQEAVDLLNAYTGPISQSEFLNDRKTQLTVERLLEILGEAAAHLSTELKAAHPEIPWRQIIGLRNVVSHEYFRVRPELLWEVATHDIPILAVSLRGIIDGLGSRCD